MGRNISKIFFAAILLISVTSLLAVKAFAYNIDVKNIETMVENIINNTANSGNNSISGEDVIKGEIKTGDANAQTVVTNIVNTTEVTCCGTPTPTPTPSVSPTPTPTSPPGGENGDQNGGGNGGPTGGAEVQGVQAPPQGEVLGLATTSGEAPLGALQSLGLVWLGIGLKLLTKKLG